MTYSAVVIGAGSGGLTVAIGLAGLGRRVALVESVAVGGDCTNTGCIPSKALIHQARSGVTNPFAHVRERRDGLRDRETSDVGQIDGIDFFAGFARLTGTGRVSVESDSGDTVDLEGRHVIIATGSAPRRLPVTGLPDELVLTNENLWDLPGPLGHLAIVGGGPIGMEMAPAFRRLGSAVTVVEMADRVLPALRPEVAEIVGASLTEMGVELVTGAEVERFQRASRTLQVHPSSGPPREVGPVDGVLFAVGRQPRIAGLGVDDLGVRVGRSGIITDAWGRTSVKRVWAVGDVTGRTFSTHGANAMGRRVVQAIGLPKLPRVAKVPSIPTAVFTEPEVAAVGLSASELSEGWTVDALLDLRVDLADVDRGYTDGQRTGAVLVTAERLTGRILQATIVGPGAAEAIGLFTLAIDRRISLHKLYRLVHPYPTYAGAIGQVADDFARQTLPNLRAEAASWLSRLPGRLTRRLTPVRAATRGS